MTAFDRELICSARGFGGIWPQGNAQERNVMSNKRISRRTCLVKAYLLMGSAGAPFLLPCSSSAAAKVSKAAAEYQDHPSRMQMCGMCKFFTSASGRKGGMMGGGMMGCGMMGRGMMSGECEVVEGRISAMGWCKLYAATG
jgi:hypothetical protein